MAYFKGKGHRGPRNLLARGEKTPKSKAPAKHKAKKRTERAIDGQTKQGIPPSRKLEVTTSLCHEPLMSRNTA